MANPVGRPPKKPAPVTAKDLALISSERLAELKAQARKEVEDERRKAAEAAILAQEISVLKREDRPEEQERTLIVDLPAFTMDIRLDGRVYEHGRTYTVPKSIYDTLLEQISRAWRHEEEIHPEQGPNRAVARHARNFRITPHGVVADDGPVRVMTDQGVVRF